MNDRFDPVAWFLNKTPRPVLAGFAAGVAAGFLTHLYMLTNKLPNWDDLVHMDGYGAAHNFGRWILPRVHKFFSQQSAPALNGSAAILLYSVSVALIVLLLQIKSLTAAALLGALFLTFPAVTSNMTFMFLGGTYAVAVLLAVLAVVLTVRFRLGFLPGILCLYWSMGIYQAYLPFAAALFLLVLLAGVLRGEEARSLVRKGLVYLGVLSAATLAYLLYIRTLDLVSYRGIDSAGVGGFRPIAIARAYHRVLQFFVTAPPSYVTPFFVRVTWALLVVSVAALCYLLWKRRLWKTPGLCLLLCLILMLYPLAASAVYVMAQDVQKASTVMIFGYMAVLFVPVLLLDIVILEEGEQRSGGVSKRERALAVALTALLALCAYGNYRVAGEAYFRTSLAFERVENYYNRMMSYLETQSDYVYGDPYVIAGDPWPEPHVLSAYNLKGEEFLDLEGLALENGLFTSATRYRFVRTYLGITGEELSQERYEAIVSSEEFQAMPIYPSDGCVRKIGDIWVLKAEK